MDQRAKLLLTSWLFLTILLLAFGTSAQDLPASGLYSMEHDGLERVYRLTVPEDYAADSPLPLLVVLHSSFSSGPAIQAITGLDDSGYVIAYPQSYHPYWNNGRMEAEFSVMYEPVVDDVGYLTALIDHLQAEFNTDALYLTGMGNGALMAMRMVCEMPERIDAVATVAALVWDYYEDICEGELADPVNLLMFHGSYDRYYYPSGRTLEGTDFYSYSRDETLEFWAERNGCTNLHVEDRVWRFECDEGTTTALYTHELAGHSWLRTGDYKLNRFGLDMTERILSFFAGDDRWADPPDEVEDMSPVGRSFHLYVPTTYEPSDPQSLPLVFVMHGRPGTGISMGFISDFHRFAEEEGFAVVFPDGINLGGGWASGEPDTLEDTPTMLNDTRFLYDIVDDLSIELNIDLQRMYVTGFSNGGYMAERMACVGSDRFAAAAFVGASMFTTLPELCEGKEPVPILMIHGTEDVSIGWDGAVRDMEQLVVGWTYSVPETAGFWLYHNGCDIEAYEEVDVPTEDDSPETRVKMLAYRQCSEPDAPVLFYFVLGGGHNWPGVPGIISDNIAGNVTTDIHASEVIWDFFNQYTLDG